MADKIGHFNVMILMSAFTTALILGLWLPATGNAAIITFATLLVWHQVLALASPLLYAQRYLLSQR